MSTHPKTQMKQTNNAIKFLMAQYRAIFKHAYLKSIASAVALTAGLAITASNAFADTDFDASTNSFSGEVTIVDSGSFTMNGVDYKLTSGKGVSFSTDKDGNYGVYFTGSSGGTVFKLNNASFDVKSDDHAGYGARVGFANGTYQLSGTNTISQQLTLDGGDSASITIKGGRLVIDGLLTVSKNSSSSTISMAETDVTINAAPVSTDGQTTEGGLIIDQDITVGNFTFKDDSYILLFRDDNWGTSGAEDSGFKPNKTINVAQNKTVLFTGQHSLLGSASREQIEGKEFSLTLSGSGGSANVEVQNGASLNLNRSLTLQNIAFSNDGTVNNDHTFTVSGNSTYTNNGVFNNVESGTLVISGASAIFANNGALNNDGEIIVSGSGTLEIKAGSTFNNTDGALTISGGTASIDTSVVKHIDDLGGDQKHFINSGDLVLNASTSANIFTIDGNSDLDVLLNKGSDGNYSGEVTLKGVTLDSTADLSLSNTEMAKFSGSGTAVIHSNKITYTVSGTTSSAQAENLNDVTVFGDTLKFVKKVADADNPTVVSGSSEIFQTYNLDSDATKLLVSGGVTINMDNAEDSALTGSINPELTLSGGSAAVLTISDLTVTAKKDITVGANGELSVVGDNFATGLDINGALKLTDASSKVEVTNADLSAKTIDATAATTGKLLVTNGTLTIKGDGSGSTVDVSGGSNITVNLGTLNLSDANDTVGLTLKDNTSGTWTINSTYSGSKINIQGTTVKVYLTNAGLATGTDLTVKAANSLLGTLVSGSGLIDIGTTKVDLPDPDSNGELIAGKVADVNGDVIINFANDQTKDIVLTKLSGTVNGGWESVKTEGTGNSVEVAEGGKLAIYGTADGTNIVSDSTGKVVGITLNSASTAEILSSGNVSEINGDGTLSLASTANVNVVNKSDNTKAGDVDVATLTGTGSLTAGKINAGEVALNQGAKIAADSLAIDTNGSFEAVGTQLTVNKTLDLSNIATTDSASITDSVVNANTLKVTKAVLTDSEVSGDSLSGDSSSSVVANGTVLNFNSVKVNSLELAENSVALLGTVTLTSNGSFIVGTDGDADTAASSAKAQVDTLDLNGGTLRVDPSYNQPTALVTVDKFTDTITDGDPATDIGVANGNIFVGQNSAVGLGVKTLGELENIIAKYQVGSALNSDKYGAILYIDGKLALEKGQGITLTSQSYTGFKSSLPAALSGAEVAANTIYFGKNTALIVNADNGATIQFADDGASSYSRLVADGGEIVLNGDVKTGNHTIFSTDDSNGMQIVQGNGKVGGSITVTTENNLLVGTIQNGANNTFDGKVDLGVNEEQAASIINAASRPVYDTILAYARGYNGPERAEADVAEGDKLYESYTVNTDGTKTYDRTYNNYFLQQELLRGNGSATEKVARLGVYGGVAQAALTAGSTTYEAVAGRMGVGAQNGSITFANNGQGAGLWVTPVYKNHDSDGFDAQGLSYGADMDLYGVALGGDFTMANGLRVGAAFNVGSGDADGQGAGAGVTNDFDYYGFTVYGGYTMDKLSVVADVSYTAVDNDVEANTQFEKVTASMDSSNLSVGLTGQYAFDYGTVSITPHAGLRYTYIDMDDYTVKGSEDIARYAADSFSVFSIPVGVTISKDITAGSWVVKPAFDLTLTANMGDDSVDGSVTWAGVENLKTNVESEVIDSFTYGATLGVSAQSGNFSMGLGVNYTGASNADEYGVSANARFVF